MRRFETTLIISSLLASGCGSVGEPSSNGDGVGDGPFEGSPSASGAPTNAGNPSNPNDPTNPNPTNGLPNDPLNPAEPSNTTELPNNPSNPDPSNPNNPSTTPASTCAPGVPGTSQIPRLTNAQYDRTLRDLLGVTGVSSAGNAPPSNFLATEQAGNLTSLAWSGYQTAADRIAAEVMSRPELTANFMKCSPDTSASCLSDTITEFGRRAYRRPLSPDEVADFQALVTGGAQITPTGAPREIAEVILSAFLQSPSFIQRTELTESSDGAGRFLLSHHEVASRLSYLLWGSTPDAELDEAADNNLLQTKEQILAQAQRMIRDPKARDVATEFHRSYLHITVNSRWESTRKDTSRFPAFVDGVVPDLLRETELLIDGVFTSGGSFKDLLTTNMAYVNSRTAPLYGLNPRDYTEALAPVPLDAGSRPGFLTRAGFLSAYSSFERTSPILRGAFITKEILGINPGTPDPEAALAPLPTGAGLDTNRKQVDAQTSAGDCAGCHKVFVNPPGFVLEAYDASGAIQTNERDTGAPIDTVAEVSFGQGTGPVTVSDPAQLMAGLAASVAAQRYYAERWVGFAYGRVLASPDVCVVDQLQAGLSRDGYSIQDLVTDLTQSDSFRIRALEVTQ